MKGIVQELVAIVGASESQAGSRQYASGSTVGGAVSGKQMAEGTEVGTGTRRGIAAPALKAKMVQERKEVKVPAKKVVKPDEVIPMEDKADFKDF